MSKKAVTEESQASHPPADDAKPAPEDMTQEKSRRGKYRRGGRWLWGVFSVVGAFVTAFLLIAAFAVLLMLERSFDLPDWAVRDIERRINAQTNGERIHLGAIAFGLTDRRLRPTVQLRNVEVIDRVGDKVVSLPHLSSKLDVAELLQGRFAVETIELSQAELELTRDKNGQISFTFGADFGGEDLPARSIKGVMARIDALFAGDLLRELREVRADAMRLTLNDARNGQKIVLEHGRFTLRNGTYVLALDLGFDFEQPGLGHASVGFSADKAKGSDGARLVGKFRNLNTRSLASQVAALSFLNVLDAPTKGALTAEIDGDGRLAAMAGTLDIDKGVLHPAAQAKPVRFNAAKVYVRYDAATARLMLDEITLDAPELRLQGEGHADLSDIQAGIPQTLLGQFRFQNIRLDPEGVFSKPVTFHSGALDLRYRPADLRLDVGQLVLRDPGVELVTTGVVRVAEKGWSVAMDAKLEQIKAAHLLQLWPETAAENLRNWLSENILGGEIHNAHAALRFEPEQKPKAGISFEFQQARVKYVKTLPPIERASGYASISQNRFHLHVDLGQVVSRSGGVIRADGSQMEVPDLDGKPTLGVFDLKLAGPLQAALSILDEKPFGFIRDAGLPVDVASGQAEIDAGLELPLEKDLTLAEVQYDVFAQVRDVRSEQLVADKLLEAPQMTVRAADNRLEIGGKGTLETVPIDVMWSRQLGPGSGDRSQITGKIELSERMLEAFEIALPEDSVSGRGLARVEVALEKGRDPQVELRSDLRGIGLEIEALSWRKPPKAEGALRVVLSAGEVPDIQEVSLQTAGLSSKGYVRLTPSGTFERAVFEPLKVRDILDSRVEIVGRGQGRFAQLIITGGTIDIRKFGLTSGGGSPEQGGGQEGGAPLTLNLDRLQVTDSIALDNFRGQFSNQQGLKGRFSADLNDAAGVSGLLVPSPQGPSVRIESQDSGRVLAASGLFKKGNGGTMVLSLQPTGKPGHFNGSLKIKDIKVKKAPVLADLLSAISVIGLLEQLSGRGILFSDVRANFLLTPGGVTLRSSSAVGPSLGITIDGDYDIAQSRMNMQGVVSPIYVVNRLVGALFTPRKGEGLFGFNYSLRGKVEDPKVGVNPLSVLTPGVFREIFRRPPPEPRD